MPQKEVTGKRPTNYSQWHRYPTLPKRCLLADSDWFEMRDKDGKVLPVACIETMEIGALFIKTAQQEYPLWPTKKALLRVINERMDIPVFVVRHTSDCKLFALSRITQGGEETPQVVLGEQEYKNFLIAFE